MFPLIRLAVPKMNRKFVKKYCACCIIILITHCCVVYSSSYADAEAVFKDLLSNYTKEMRPLLDQSQPVYVGIYPIFRSLNAFDEVTGTMTLIMVLTEIWYDEKLRWDPHEYNGVYKMVLPQTLVWKPELFLINPAKVLEPIGDEAFKVRVENDGLMQWYTGGEIKTSCSPDMTYFPFDIQTCNILFAAWGYHSDDVVFYKAANGVDMTNVTGNGAWSVKEASYKTYHSCGMSMVEIIMKIERKALYYILTMIFPILSLCAMNPMVFTLPYECGERISFCITILLSFAVFMTMTGDIIPRVSEPMPLISIYLFIVQSYSGVIATMNAFILRAYSHKEDDPVPSTIGKVASLCNKVLSCESCGSKVKPELKNAVHPFKDANIVTKGIDNLILQEYKENLETVKEELEENNPLDTTSWQTVGKTMDRVCFRMSYFVLMSISLVFLILSVTRTS